MTIVRLFVSEPSGTWESVRYRVPVRIGRHPCNDCRFADRGVSRFHLELDWADERLRLRDLGSRNGVLVRVAGEMHRLRGSELTTASREVEFAVGGVWVKARVEMRSMPDAAVAMQTTVEDLLDSCARAATRPEGPLEILSSLGNAMVAVRGILRSDELSSSLTDADRGDEMVAALRRWTQATLAAVGYVEGALRDDAREHA